MQVFIRQIVIFLAPELLILDNPVDSDLPPSIHFLRECSIDLFRRRSLKVINKTICQNILGNNKETIVCELTF